MDCYKHILEELDEGNLSSLAYSVARATEMFKNQPTAVVYSHLTRIDDLKPNEETIQFFLDKGNKM